MATISGISGLVANFDTKGAVDELLGLRKFEISQLTKKQTAETEKQAAFTELNSLLSNFRNQSIAMRDVGTFFAYTANLNSSDAAVPASTLVDVAGDNSVTAGNHSIVVEQLATTARSSSSIAVKDNAGAAITDANAALNFNSGSFVLNGTTINVSAADSLQSIANNINTASTGVSASVIKVSDADFRLVLAADTTGASAFTLTSTDLDAAGPLANLQLGATGQTNAKQVLEAGKDAQVTIDGITITRSTNTIGDAISGLTFTLKQANPLVTVDMSIGVDTNDVQNKVLDFIDSYNAVYTYINDQFKINNDTGSNGILANESILTSLQSSLTSGLLKSVPGLQSDRNSLVRIGIEPNELGMLSINDNLFTNFLNNDASAIRDVFVAQGSSTTPGLQFLTAGTNTISGNYSVNIDQVATKAAVTGMIDVVTTPLASDQTITLTEDGSARQAIVDLLTGDSQSTIISKLNTEFSTVRTESRLFDQMLIDSSTTQAANGATTFENLGGITGETITISGTNRSGSSVQSTFSIIDQNQDTISDLLSAIQSAFNQQVTASIDTSGRIQVQDNNSGDSQLAVTLSSDGALNFGVDSTALTTEGRFAMSLQAVSSGNFVTIEHKYYGAKNGFTISGASIGLGITDSGVTPISGSDIAGTINGETTTGSGQVMVGSAGNADGIGVLYSGAAAAPFSASMAIGIGAAASFDGAMDLFSNPFSGLIQNSIFSSENTYTTISEKITALEIQLEQQRTILTRSFSQMEASMNTLQSTGNFLTAQIDAFNAGNK
ncbi:MAG: flagellar hook-associated protein [Zetaproteobacteria bacterium CG2_30_46_52]|nr:MAG: flagellar hook-associated protein [Zetaproteobacteria bacterium CG2_30_46_52]